MAEGSDEYEGKTDHEVILILETQVQDLMRLLCAHDLSAESHFPLTYHGRSQIRKRGQVSTRAH